MDTHMRPFELGPTVKVTKKYGAGDLMHVTAVDVDTVTFEWKGNSFEYDQSYVDYYGIEIWAPPQLIAV